jgi:hypothetical protein
MLEVVGHSRIRQKIRQSAMGVVCEGWDDWLQRPVAVKAIEETKFSIYFSPLSMATTF